MPEIEFEFGSTRSPAARRLERRLLHPVDYLRTRLTRGRLRVGASVQDVRRGGALDARVTIASARGLGEVEVGLVCTEYYESRHGQSSDGDGVGGPGRGTSAATAYETWLPVAGSPGVHSVGLAVPAEAPFSYEGGLLCFKWEAVARGRRKRRLDAQPGRSCSARRRGLEVPGGRLRCARIRPPQGDRPPR